MSIKSLWIVGIIGIVVLCHLYLQAAVTWFVLASNEDRSRKVAQLLCVWLIPFLGPIIIGYYQTEGAYITKELRESVPKLFVPFLFASGQMSEDITGGSSNMPSESIHDIWTDS